MADTGLTTEFATGSHAVRLTGNWLENQHWWVRLNQIWGGLLPSLGSECYVRGRRESAWVTSTGLSKPSYRHWRPLWLGFAACALAAITCSGVYGFNKWHQQDRVLLISWIASQQKGDDHFIVSQQDAGATLRHRPDVVVALDLNHAMELLRGLPHAHMLVDENDLRALLHWDSQSELVIDSRLVKFWDEDFILVRSGTQGTPLSEYLLTNTKPVHDSKSL